MDDKGVGWLREQMAELREQVQGSEAGLREQTVDADASWLREHMRNFIARSDSSALTTNVLGLKRAPTEMERFEQTPPGMKRNTNAVALDLVHQAAQVMNDMERRASEAEARACSVVRDAIQKLKLAQERIQSAEHARRIEDQEVRNKLQEAVRALEKAERRVAAAEARASAAEARAKRAEAQANETERAVARIEEAIRTQLLRERGGGVK